VVEERVRLFTTNFVVAETHALVLARRERAIALRVLQEIDRSTIALVRVSARDEQRARQIIFGFQE
jgi:predicted nucleic acid-binding protein